MTRTGTRATDEQRAAFRYLGSLGDSLAPWVQSTGPIDAYEPHVPVEVRSPLEWFSFAVVSRQLSRGSAVAIYHRLVAQLGGSVTAERVVATGERTMRGVGLSSPKARAIRGLAERADDGLLEPANLEASSDAATKSAPATTTTADKHSNRPDHELRLDYSDVRGSTTSPGAAASAAGAAADAAAGASAVAAAGGRPPGTAGG